jgi:hypothetical protein
MSFKDQTFQRRFAAMGDEAEGVFEAVWGDSWVRFGLNRPAISMAKLPPMIRYTPDYLTSFELVEVQGAGKDQTFKLKVEKHAALLLWSHFLPVRIFVWDTTNKRYCSFLIDELNGTLGVAALDAFPEGKAYYAVPLGELPGSWGDYEAEAA